MQHQEHGRLQYMAAIEAVIHPILAFHVIFSGQELERKVEI